MRQDKTRLEGNYQIGGTGTRLFLYSSVALENLGKIWEINGTESGPRRGCSRMLGMGNFMKNPVPGKWHLGTHTIVIRYKVYQ